MATLRIALLIGALTLLTTIPAAPATGNDPAPAVSTTVVINELAPAGPFGSLDEFLELRNISNQSIHIGGWLLKKCTSSGPPVLVMSFPAGVFMAPKGQTGQYLLLAGFNYFGRSGSSHDTPDIWDSSDTLTTGGWQLVNPSGVADSVGLSSSSSCTETDPAPSCNWAAEEAATRDSNGTDTDDNSDDFTCQNATPTNSTG